jgi:hypothetical protein
VSPARSKILIDVNNLEPLDLSRMQLRAGSPAPSSLSQRRPHSSSISSVVDAEPVSGQSTPRARKLRSQPSKSSFASRFGPSWLLGAFGRSQPSFPTAATETVGRQDVAFDKSRPSSPSIPKVNVEPILVPGAVEVSPPTPSPRQDVTQPLPIAGPSRADPPTEVSKSLHSVHSLARSRSPGESWGRSADLGRASRHVTVNPCNPSNSPESSLLEGRRWQHVSPHASNDSQALMKWTSLIAPACLPLTTDYLPTPQEIQEFYQVNFHEIVCFQDQVSFLIRPDAAQSNLALAVMREMASQRLGRECKAIKLIRKLSIHCLAPSLGSTLGRGQAA